MPYNAQRQYIRSNLIYDGYIEAMESGTTSDFPVYLQEKLNRIMLRNFGLVQSNWRAFAKIVSFNDFKTHNVMTPLGESDDLIEVPEGMGYADSELLDSNNIPFKLATYGRTFSISRQALINDDYNQIQDNPARLGRAGARTLAKKVVAALETPGNAYDGVAFFGDHKQDDGSTTAANTVLTGSALTRQTLRTAIERMKAYKDVKGNLQSITPRFLIVPPALEFTAREIVGSPTLGGAGAGASEIFFTENIMRGAVEVVVEPFLTSATTWYLVANIDEVPAIQVAFLNGKETPDLILKDPAARLVLGGNDPYSFEFDEVIWKVRHDWATKAIEPRGILKVTA